MSEKDQATPPPPPSPPPTMSLGTTPNAEKYVLEADAMRRRQLRSALLHGSSRTWREHRRVWPAVAVGIIVTAVIIAGMAVQNALNEQSKKQKEQQQRLEKTQPSPPPSATSPPVTPSAGGQRSPAEVPSTVATPKSAPHGPQRAKGGRGVSDGHRGPQ